jgi:hypothetical protein
MELIRECLVLSTLSAVEEQLVSDAYIESP